MSEAKHTEGPWRVSSEIPTAIIADIPQAVDHMKYFGFDDSTPYGGYLIAESVVQPENARLIAAAPELLEALETLVQDARPVNWEDNDDPEQVEAWKKAQAAISKARGERK